LLVVALDPSRREKKGKDPRLLVESIDEYVDAYKVGIPFLLKHGKRGIRELRRVTGKPIIADLKLADIGDVMSKTVMHLAGTGVSKVIAHAFIGYRDGIEVLSKTTRSLGMDLILVVSMSHRGSEEFIDRHLEELLWLALRVRAEGVVAPATRPSVIKYIRESVGDQLKIYSPGIGVQGAEPGSALCAGADYEIVGRLITDSDNPGETAMRVKRIQLERWARCRG